MAHEFRDTRAAAPTEESIELSHIPPGPNKRVNDDRLRIFPDPERPIAFVCECDDPECLRTVILTPQEYHALAGAPVLHESHPACGGAKPQTP